MKKTLTTLLTVLFVLALVQPALGITCRKGCPCGNACISCSETCHKGSGSAGYDNDEGVPVWLIVVGVVGGLALGGYLLATAPMDDEEEEDPYSNTWSTFDLEVQEDGASAFVGFRF